MKIKLKGNKKLILEITGITFSIVLILLSLLQDFSIISIPNFLLSTIIDHESLFFTLFIVQASVATVSIVIVSIITGLINEYV